MPRSGVFLEALTSYYSTLAFDTLALMRNAQEDLRNDTFDCQKTTGRTLSLWLEACEGWWSAMLVSATPPLPTLFMTCATDSQTHVRTIKIAVPPGAALKVTDLGRVGGGDPIPRTKCTATAALRGDEMVFSVMGIGDAFAEGLYQGFVYVGERALAQVALQLEPAPPPAPEPPQDRRLNRGRRGARGRRAGR